MVIYRCPRCQQTFTSQPGAGNNDIVHDCNSGNPTLDNEDVFNLDNRPQWKYAGITNQLSTKAKIEGEDFEGVTKRGYRKTSYRQEKHQEFIDLKNRGHTQ